MSNPGNSPLATALLVCSDTWRETLKHFKQERKLLPSETLALAQAIQRYGVEAVELALLGIRFEKGNKDFDPSQHVYLARILRPDRFERFVGLGAQEMNRRAEEQRALAEKIRLEAAHVQEAALSISSDNVSQILGKWSKKKQQT